MRIILVALVLLDLVSCSSVVSRQPVGATPVDFEKVKLAGTWTIVEEEGMTNEECAFVVKDPMRGTIVFFDKDEELELVVRQTGDTIFVNLGDENEAAFLWGKLVLDAKTLRIVPPDVAKFSDLVRQERIPGKVIQEENIDAQGNIIRTGPKVVLDDPTGKWVAQLVAGELGNLFDNEDPTILKRVRGIN